MNRLIIKRKEKIDLWDWLLVVGLALSPMTSLRIWKVGPGEFLCALWTLRYLNLKKIFFSDVFKFFVAFILCISIGTLIGIYRTPEGTSPLGIATWIYLGYIACMIYYGLRLRSAEYIEHLFFIGATVSACWHLFLYAYSLTVSRSFFGIGLWYGGGRYAGGATNPHQLALMMSGLSIYFLRNVFKKYNAVFSLAMSVCCLVIELATESSTGLASVAAAYLVFMYVFTARLGASKKMRAGIMIVETLLIILAVVVFFNPLFNFVYNWVSSDKNGLGRLYYVSRFGESFEQSPIFGLGPGTHVINAERNKEYHNTYLEIVASGGIVAAVAFIWFTLKSIKSFTADVYFYPLLATLYVYGFGGFAMRRLPYWWMLSFALILADKRKQEKMLLDGYHNNGEDMGDDPGERV